MIRPKTPRGTGRTLAWAAVLTLAVCAPGVARAQAPAAAAAEPAGSEKVVSEQAPPPAAPEQAMVAAAQFRPPQRRPSAAGRGQPGRPGSLEISVAADWLGPSSLGSSNAQFTSNGSSTPFTYFSTAGRMKGTPAVDGRVTYNLARPIAVEGGFVFSRPSVTFSISNDTEAPGAVNGSGERLSQYFADANVLVFLPALGFSSGRGRAYVGGGGGYLRQLHAGNLKVESGSVYNAGAGMKYFFAARPAGVLKGFGLRVDLRAYYGRGGYSFDGRATWTAALGGGLIVAF